nr:UBP-type zinc finger domain-containing protein [Natronosporangium hydrolyticum]
MDQIRVTETDQQECAECVATGDDWVQLRLCLSCGVVRCCDDSINKHATAHFRQTNHPIVESLEPGEHWRYCYIDNTLVRPPLGQRS